MLLFVSSCSKELNQWEPLTEYAQSKGHSNPYLMLECAWRVSNWTSMKEALVQVRSSNFICKNRFKCYVVCKNIFTHVEAPHTLQFPPKYNSLCTYLVNWLTLFDFVGAVLSLWCLVSVKWINLILLRHSSPLHAYTHRENVKTGHKVLEMQLYY